MKLQRGHIDPATPEITDIQVLTRADLNVLLETRPVKVLQSLKDSHHRLARAVSTGLSNNEIAKLYGTSANRLATLKQDPAFIELVAHYRGLITAEFIRAADPVIEYLDSVKLKALAMIEDKLDDADAKGEFLPSRDLVAFSELGLDRTGYGKVNKNLNLNVDFAAQLEAARKRSGRAKEIDGTATSTHVSRVVQAAVPRSVSAPNLAPESIEQRPSLLRRI
jgi:hypothetical protein